MWLLKTEPSDYAFEDLEREGEVRWDGVRSPAGLRNLRLIKAGDLVFVYHTGNQKAVIGVAEVTRGAYRDPKASDQASVVIDIKAVRRLGRPVSLAEIKVLREFARSPLVREGRLSVVPVSPAQGRILERKGKS
jgi:predicted RNA-binding protein with PUA-like domain